MKREQYFIWPGNEELPRCEWRVRHDSTTNSWAVDENTGGGWMCNSDGYATHAAAWDFIATWAMFAMEA